MPTLRQLRYLTALADHGHFGRAARECAISQPSLSQQVADLEAELGIQLIDRSGRGAALTETGRLVVERSRTILSAVADLAKVAREAEATLLPLRLGVIPTIAPFLLPAAFPAIRAIYGKSGFRVREAVTQTLLDELRDNKLDVLLLSLPIDEVGIETLALFDDPFFLVASASDRIKGPIVPESLSAADLLLLDDGHCLRAQALSVCGKIASDLREQLGATSLATLASLVAGGLGQTLIPRMALETLFGGSKRVKILPFRKPSPVRTIGLAYRSTSSSKAAIAQLGAAIKAVAV
jgi:LysR family hydrogen peroxide-inducible transcriptional activator